MKFRLIPLAIATPFLLVSAHASAQSSDTFDQIWSHAEFFGDRSAKNYPALKLRGRYQGQYYNVDGHDDGDADGFETRRLRLGLDAFITSNIRLGFDLNINSDGKEPAVDDIDYLALDWKLGSNTKLSVGKLRRKPLTREDSTSSNSILTVERSLASGAVAPSNLGGVYVSHKLADWSLGAGVMTGGLDDDLELPDGDGGTAIQINIGRPLNESTEWRIDYLFNEGHAENDALEPFRHTLSLNSESQWGAFNFQSDVILAESLEEGPGDLIGLVLMPSLAITSKLHGVFRYTYLRSSEDDGVRLSSRYERRVDNLGDERGKKYRALYLGANYLVYGNKLKVMLGLEHASMTRGAAPSFEATTLLSAFRVYF